MTFDILSSHLKILLFITLAFIDGWVIVIDLKRTGHHVYSC